MPEPRAGKNQPATCWTALMIATGFAVACGDDGVRPAAPDAFEAFTPDPYATDGSGSFISRTSDFQATFSGPVEGAGPETFTVRGLQSGPAFLGQSYGGNGTTTIITPSGSFFPGEEIEIVLTPALMPFRSCADCGVVARLRVEAGSGTGSFGPASDFDVGRRPVSVAIADLTGNGVLDLVTANSASNNVSVLLGNGDGTFQAQQTFDVDGAPTSVAIGDLTGNGRPDLVTANVNANGVSVLLGNGDGTFQPRQMFAAGLSPVSIAIGDLDGNGVLDLVTPNPGQDNVSVLLGNGDGTFQPKQTFDVPGSPCSVAIGDLTRNGIPDLVTTNTATSNGSVLLGNGDGTFQPQQTLHVGRGRCFVAIGDLNSNGIPDLVAAISAEDHVTVLLGNGDGTFQPPAKFHTEFGPSSVAIGDLNGDGVLDLVTANDTNGHPENVFVLFGNGDGTFQPYQPFDVGVGQFSSVAIGDLTGNGSLDLAIVQEDSDNVSVLLGL